MTADDFVDALLNDPNDLLKIALEENAQLRAALRKERDAHYATIGERDGAEEAADELAYAIAPIEVIGEHSNINDPWKNAVEALGVERQQHADALGRMQVSFSEAEQRAEAAEAKAQALERDTRILSRAIPLEEDLSDRIDEMCKYLAMEQGFTLAGIARLFIDVQRRMSSDWLEIGRERRARNELEREMALLRSFPDGHPPT